MRDEWEEDGRREEDKEWRMRWKKEIVMLRKQKEEKREQMSPEAFLGSAQACYSTPAEFCWRRGRGEEEEEDWD